MRPNRLRIIVTGLAATYPFGGVFWDYVQYVLGFHRLGHDVFYLEDTGKWCYSPTAQTFVEPGDDNARAFQSSLRRLEPGLAEAWSYRDATGRTFGRSATDVQRRCREADLFLHISASCWMRDEYFAAGRVVFIDSDPLYTQSSVPAYLRGEADPGEIERIDMLRRHDVFFTFAENIDGAECLIPRGLFDWTPTRQPIVLDCFAAHEHPIDQRRRVWTTIASWEPTEKGPVVEGRTYGGKGVEFLRFVDLPARSALPFELALSGRFPADQLRQHGWGVLDAYGVSHNPWVYRDYLATSFGEWSVAKNAYVDSRSGWFSCRSACYLAAGVPVVVQDTGFTKAIPAGAGVLTFTTPDEAAAALDAVLSNPLKHARAAREIAAEYFDAEKVLTRLLETALSHAPTT